MAKDSVIPTIAESVTEGVIASWLKDDGAYVERDEPILELETDKITMEILAEASGSISHKAAVGDTVAVGAVVGTIDESAEAPASGAASSEASGEKAASSGSSKDEAPARGNASPAATAVAEPPRGANTASRTNGDVRATPLAQKVADEYGVDLSRVRGTGAGNRVREQDVIAWVQSHDDASAVAPAPAAGPSRATNRTRMTPLRQRIASRLVEAQQTAAMLTTFNEVDMGETMAVRKRHKDAFGEKHEIGLGFMSFFVKAAVGALKAFPLVNASIVEDDGHPAIETHDYMDISIAVSSPKGLVVPVLRNCENQSFADIERNIKDFAVRARDGKLSLDELQGGTFTITNGGIFGSLMSTPILNPPQSAILGMHAIKSRAVEDPNSPGMLALRPMMYLALSYDHRIIDG
ncbi:MAG: 2-oxoglutarate dehydrogenase complex dihydrolipoyllysine-residue succinyltransferase, partial [Phycisphaerales bacterium]|nr:2-oxoglutarate dehydrogenase complex dihydrolipoyllysine-residue succinyltransferase [Phycisphaerales bacterium]